MVLLRYLSTVIFVVCAVLIATGAVSGLNKKVGDRVSFRPDKLPDVPSITSVIWKHKNTDGTIVKAIEWDEGDILTPNPRFKGITTVDEKTGEITITNLKVEHSGVYFFEINSKEQQQRFSLAVMEPVPKPKIDVEMIKTNPDAVYLTCNYSETITWNNSAKEELIISKLHPKGESIIVEKNKGNPENIYTCTLKNGVSEETSNPVHKKNLFKEDSNAAVIGGTLFGVLFCGIIVILIVLYICLQSVHNFVNTLCPCIRGSFLDRFPKKIKTEGQINFEAAPPGDSNGTGVKDDSKADTEAQSTPADSNGTGVKDDSKELVPLTSEMGTADPQQQ